MPATVTRHFVTVQSRWGQRQVHYRRAGQGPVVLLMHQSPQSSRELVPLMEQWGEHFTVLAPDTPGYGLSDPLGVDQAQLADFADANVEFMDAVGATRFGTYGFHTGGMIGIALAHAYPDRVAAMSCNGVAVLTDEERAAILAEYLPEVEPRWDGSHLAWLWARMREQTIFFPWHDRRLSARMNYTVPDARALQTAAMEFLRAVRHYHVAYRAAFVFEAEKVVPGLRVPALISAGEGDPICSHLQRLPAPAPEGVIVNPLPGHQEVLQACFSHLQAHPGDELGAVPETEPLADRIWREMIDAPQGEIHVRRCGSRDAKPLMIIHGPGESGAVLEPLLEQLGRECAVICPDLPGHGETDARDPGSVDVKSCAASAVGVMDALGIESASLLGVDGGGVVALAIAEQSLERVRNLALADLPVVSDEQRAAIRDRGMPSIDPEWHGGHLLKAWHMVRDSRLFFPWFQRDPDGIRNMEPELDDWEIHCCVIERLKSEGAWQSLLKDQLNYPLAARLSAVACPVVVASRPTHPGYDRVRAAAAAAGREFVALENSPGAWELEFD